MRSEWIMVLLALLLSGGIVRGQNFLQQNALGISVAYPFRTEILPGNFRYKPTILSVNYVDGLLRDPGKINIHLGISPQFVIVPTPFETMYEWGVNFSICVSGLVAPDWILYLGLASGPHYVQLDNEHQAGGFIFSDKVSVGMRWRLPQQKFPFELLLEASYLHLSNGGLKEPNRGLDAGIWRFGGAYLIGQ